MGKMAVAPQKRVLEQNFQLLTPLKFGSPGFLSVGHYGNARSKIRAKLPITVGHYGKKMAITENGKNGRSTPKTRPRAKLPITDPPQVWVSRFLSVDGNAKLVSAITENGKNGRAPQKCVLEQNFQLLTPFKFGSPVF